MVDWNCGHFINSSETVGLMAKRVEPHGPFWNTVSYKIKANMFFYCLNFIRISRMFRTADYSYILPTHRATVYLMGIFLAYIMKTKQKVIFSKVGPTFSRTLLLTDDFFIFIKARVFFVLGTIRYILDIGSYNLLYTNDISLSHGHKRICLQHN